MERIEPCGRCGTEREYVPYQDAEGPFDSGSGDYVKPCRLCGESFEKHGIDAHNARQRRIRMERTNAAALRIYAGKGDAGCNPTPEGCLNEARDLIAAQDAAVQAGFAASGDGA